MRIISTRRMSHGTYTEGCGGRGFARGANGGRAGRLSRNKKKINTQPVEVCVYILHFSIDDSAALYINAELENCNRICTGPFVARLFFLVFWRGFQTR